MKHPAWSSETARGSTCRRARANSTKRFSAADGLFELRDWVSRARPRCAREVDPSARIGPPIARPSKIVCIGLNFSDHAAESGMPLPAEPVIFFKSTTALAGPNDDVRDPARRDEGGLGSGARRS